MRYAVNLRDGGEPLIFRVVRWRHDRDSVAQTARAGSRLTGDCRANSLVTTLYSNFARRQEEMPVAMRSSSNHFTDDLLHWFVQVQLIREINIVDRDTFALAMRTIVCILGGYWLLRFPDRLEMFYIHF